MDEFKKYFEKNRPPFRGDAFLLDQLLIAFGGRKGCSVKQGRAASYFQDADLMAQVEGVVHKGGYKTDLTEDESMACEIDTIMQIPARRLRLITTSPAMSSFKGGRTFMELEDSLTPPFVATKTAAAKRSPATLCLTGPDVREERSYDSALQRAAK
jgi:hypothetical protein